MPINTPQRPRRAERRANQARTRARWRVLVLHTHNLLREGLVLMLSELDDVEVIGHTASSDEVVRLARDQHPDVVLVDADVPDEDGHLVTRLKQAWPQTHVLLLAERAVQAHVEHYLNEGVEGFTLKQVTFQELADTIRQVAGGQTYLHPAAAAILVRTLSSLTRRQPSEGPVLTQRQKEILRLVALGMQNKQIARQLGIGVDTVKTHISRILDKLEVSSRTEAVARALREGLVR